MAMAIAGNGRRLSEVLREQQEPFHLPFRDAIEAAEYFSSVNDKGATVVSWGRAVRRALPGWRLDGLAFGCFPYAARKRKSFRRLPRAGHDNDDAVAATESDGDARRLSPVSVLGSNHSS